MLVLVSHGEDLFRSFLFTLPDQLSSCNTTCTKGALFKIVLLLQQQGFILFQLVQELRQKRPIEGDTLLAMLALLFSPLVQNEVPFPFRSSMDRTIGVGNTLDPLPTNVGIQHTYVVRFLLVMVRFVQKSRIYA